MATQDDKPTMWTHSVSHIVADNYNLWIKVMLSFHPPGLHGYKLTEDKQSDVIYLYTYFKHQLKWIKSFSSFTCPCNYINPLICLSFSVC
jgi:hypothetical protein